MRAIPVLLICVVLQTTSETTDNPVEKSEYRDDKILTGAGSTNPRPQDQVTETDLQLLHALEKFVTRFDKLESRVAKLEELFLYLLQGTNKQPAKSNPCPPEFVELGKDGSCYLFSRPLRRRMNWKAAQGFCKDLGAKLMELDTPEELEAVANYLGTEPSLRGTLLETSDQLGGNPGNSVWAGGLNPGLVWIWMETGRPISNEVRLWASREDMKQGSGVFSDSPRRCLRLRPVRKGVFKYSAAVCGDADYFACEYEDNFSARQLRALHRELILKEVP